MADLQKEGKYFDYLEIHGDVVYLAKKGKHLAG